MSPPEAAVVIENDAPEREVCVSMRRDAHRSARVLADRAAVPVPEGEGRVTVQLSTGDADAALTFDPRGRDPVLSVRDDRVVVAALD